MRSPLRRRVGIVVAGAGVALAALAALAPAAQAHGAPYTVTAGSAPSGTDATFRATSQGSSPQVSLTDTTTGFKLNCTSASLAASVRTGTAASGVALGTVDGANSLLINCTGPFNLPFAFRGYGTWNVNVSDTTSGVTTATISNFRGTFTGTAGPPCTFDLGANSGTFSSSDISTVSPGTLALKYTNSSQLLDVPATNPGSFGVWNVNPKTTKHNCIAASVLNQGDKFSVSASFKVSATTSAYNPIAIN